MIINVYWLGHHHQIYVKPVLGVVTPEIGMLAAKRIFLGIVFGRPLQAGEIAVSLGGMAGPMIRAR